MDEVYLLVCMFAWIFSVKDERCFVFNAGLTIQIMPNSAVLVVIAIVKPGILRV